MLCCVCCVVFIMCMLCCIYIVYVVLYLYCACCVVLLYSYTCMLCCISHSGKEERLQPIARSLNYESINQSINHSLSSVYIPDCLYLVSRGQTAFFRHPKNGKSGLAMLD